MRLCTETERNPIALRTAMQQFSLQVEALVRPVLGSCAQIFAADDEHLEYRGRADSIDKMQHLRKEIEIVVHASASPLTGLIFGVHPLHSGDVNMAVTRFVSIS